MTQKRKSIIVIAVTSLVIVSAAIAISGSVKTVVPWGSNLTPTTMVTPGLQQSGLLAWDCPGCPIGGGGG